MMKIDATTRRSKRSSFESPLGCQIWLEPGDTPARIDALVRTARESGLSRLRIFLMWTWIEREPGLYDFSLYDAVFDSAARHGLKIKATLTANSGPWHIGTPGVLHSHTGFLADAQRAPMQRYIEACVLRYRRHPALGQWLLWNEPHGAFRDRTEGNLVLWRRFLEQRYRGDLHALNHRWLTGYRSFDEIPWPEEIAHPVHRSGAWLPYRPELDEGTYRCDRLVRQLKWIAAEIRRHDPVTELCHNPIFNIENQAGGGTDLARLAGVVDRMGASYHPVFWNAQVRREDYPGMIAAGVRALATQSRGKPCELTEVMSGGIVSTGSRPGSVGAGEIVRFYLSALAAGASTVTGWCLNARQRDAEAGEFSLLDDMDRPSPRSKALARLANAVAAAKQASGTWSATPADLFLLLDRRAQAVEGIDARAGAQRYGQGAQDSGRGQWLLAQRAMEMGHVATHGTVADLPGRCPRRGMVALASHVVAWETAEVRRMLDFARTGGTLVVDALSGRKDFDSKQHKPWPGVMSRETGLTVTFVESFPDDPELVVDGARAGRCALARTHVELAPGAGWNAWPQPRFWVDGGPAVLERPFGRGRIIYLRFPLGPSLYARPDDDAWIRRLLAELLGQRTPVMAPRGMARGTVAIPIGCLRGTLVAVMAPDAVDRGGRMVRLASKLPGSWQDFWSGEVFKPDALGEIHCTMPDGVALLWNRSRHGG